MSNFDIFFLSYQETNAEQNWEYLQQKYPQSQRIHGIEGIKNAHKKIAESANSDFFFVVDGDNTIEDSFDFTPPPKLEKEALYVWRAKNPVNDLCYGFGGIKLYNKWLLLENQKTTAVDIATSIATKYVPVFTVASTTYFNASPLESWRAGFREAAKLTINIFKNPDDTASADRLETWRTVGEDRLFGKECITGAEEGHQFALINWSKEAQVAKINDFKWLNTQSQLIIPRIHSDIEL